MNEIFLMLAGFICGYCVGHFSTNFNLVKRDFLELLSTIDKANTELKEALSEVKKEIFSLRNKVDKDAKTN